jgi:signal transduction histidine kinase
VFLSIASHELRTPLTSLLLQAQALTRLTRDQTDSNVSRLARRVEVIESNVNRLNLLVNQLLDVSRIAAGRVELQPETLALDLLVGDVASRFEDVAARAGCTITLRAEATVVGQWDRLRLDQVITNLVSNAVKYGSGRPIDLTVEQLGDRARVHVRDRGIGIATGDQGRIFERFERLVSERHYGGFGLGLWIARQNIEAMGGTIRVESAPGEGSTFTVELPIVLEHPVQAH